MDKDLQAYINKPISDSREVLQNLVDAITYKCVDQKLIASVVRQTIDDFDVKQKVFLVGLANNSLRRILKLIDKLEVIEDMLSERKLMLMDDKDLIKMYLSLQTVLMQSIDYVKKVSELRVDNDKSADAILSSSVQDEDKDAVYVLTAQQRDRLRRVIKYLSDESENTIGAEDQNIQK